MGVSLTEGRKTDKVVCLCPPRAAYLHYPLLPLAGMCARNPRSRVTSSWPRSATDRIPLAATLTKQTVEWRSFDRLIQVGLYHLYRVGWPPNSWEFPETAPIGVGISDCNGIGCRLVPGRPTFTT